MADLNLDFDVTKNPAVLDTIAALDADTLIARGAEARARMDAIVVAEAATAFPVAIPIAPEGAVFRCLAVVSAHPDYRSTLGNVLAARSGEAAGMVAAGVVAYVEAGMGDAAATSYKVSVRGVGDVDTTAVTRHYGGGGHKLASSCIVARSTFDGWREASGGSGGSHVGSA